MYHLFLQRHPEYKETVKVRLYRYIFNMSVQATFWAAMFRQMQTMCLVLPEVDRSQNNAEMDAILTENDLHRCKAEKSSHHFEG